MRSSRRLGWNVGLIVTLASASGWVARSGSAHDFGSEAVASGAGGDDTQQAGAAPSTGGSDSTATGGTKMMGGGGTGGTSADGGTPTVEGGTAGAGGDGEITTGCAPEQNFDDDPKNCGSCAHDCLGGECLQGACQPIEIAKSQGRVFTIAVDANFVYWAGDGSVVAKKSIDNSGQVVELVPASAKETSYSWVLVGQTLYWGNDWKDNGVRGCALPTCANGPQSLISGTTPIRDINYDATNSTLYYTQGASVWQKPLPGGQSTQLTPTTNTAVQLATDGTFTYWSEYQDKLSVIRKIGVAGGAITPMATKGLAYLNRLRVQGKGLFVLEYPRNGSTDRDARVVRIPIPAGIGDSEPTTFAPAGKGAEDMAVDDSGVYWTQRDANATIRHCPLAGCAAAPEVLANTVEPWGITTDASAVYWTTETGLVMKLAK